MVKAVAIPAAVDLTRNNCVKPPLLLQWLSMEGPPEPEPFVRLFLLLRGQFVLLLLLRRR